MIGWLVESESRSDIKGNPCAALPAPSGRHPKSRHRARRVAPHDRGPAHRGPDDEGAYRSDLHLRPPYETVPGVASASAACRSSTWRAAGSRCPTKTAACGSSSTARSTISRPSAAGWKVRGTYSARTDTETIVHLYEDVGLECFSHLNGMFAIAIWDARRAAVSCWPAIGWARSLLSIASSRSGCCSPAN